MSKTKNQLVNFLCSRELLKDFDETSEKDSRFETRSDALRFLIREYVAGRV